MLAGSVLHQGFDFRVRVPTSWRIFRGRVRSDLRGALSRASRLSASVVILPEVERDGIVDGVSTISISVDP